MAVAFTVVTAVCLTLLAGLALRIDTTSRLDVATSAVSERSGGLARAVYFDDGVLHLEPLHEDELAQGASALFIYQLDRHSRVAATAFRSGGRTDKLSVAQRTALVSEATDESGTATEKLGNGHGGSAVWAATPVWNNDTIGAVVVVGQDLSAQQDGHDRLTVGLSVGCFALLIIAAATGYALSGRAMRPATVALAQQEQFLTEAAHELRNPLASLRLAVEAGDASHPDDRRHALGIVDRLDRLITALLARARIEAGSFEPERIALRLDQLVQNVIDGLGEDRVQLIAAPVIVVGDPVLLGLAVRNLVDNAVRYAPGTVIVRVAGRGVTVEDDGPGIPAEDRTLVQRSGVGAGAGTGSGLALVAWVVDLHSGALAFRDAPHSGLLAEITLPRVEMSGTSRSPHQ